MIELNQFDGFKDRIKSYKYTSLEYTEYEHIESYSVFMDTYEGILLGGL